MMFSLDKCRYLLGALITAAAACLATGRAAQNARPASAPAAEVDAGPSNIPTDYKGKPFSDQRYKDGAQKIPGTVMCAYYDMGGEGVAFHSASKKNHGSGELNPLNGEYLNQFRHDEAVSTSYTKFNIGADNSPFNKVTPPEHLLYVGWTEPGEWFNLTVDVADAGVYTADLLYTSNRGAQISFDINGKPMGGDNIKLETTNDPADPIAWRQWHHWNLAKSIAEFNLPKGKNLITFHIQTNGNVNLATLEFKPKDAAK
jgi:hypothetical protein